MNKKIPKLPDAQLEVMKAVWSSEWPVSTSCLKEKLDEIRPWNVSALQTLLNRLIDSGFLKSYKEGKNRYYEPLVFKDEYLAVENRTFLKKLNNNSLTALVASLYDSRAITDGDLEELKVFIETYRKGE